MLKGLLHTCLRLRSVLARQDGRTRSWPEWCKSLAVLGVNCSRIRCGRHCSATMELAPPADQRDIGIEGRFRRNAQREPDCLGTRRTDCKQCNYQRPSLEAGDIKSGTGEHGEGDGTKLKKCYGVKLALYTDIFERRGLARSKRPFVWDIHREEVTYDLDEPQGKRDQDAYEVSRLQLAGHTQVGSCVDREVRQLNSDRRHCGQTADSRLQ